MKTWMKCIIALILFYGCNDPVRNISLVYVEGGPFVMGSDEAGGEADEYPAHIVNVNSFYLSSHEVSQRLWVRIMKHNPSYFQHSDNPVESVSHQDIQLFFERLNSITGKRYRLPTEIEWEYAASGGKDNNNYTYSGGDIIDTLGWYRDNSEEITHPVGSLNPNSLGLYDMTGNVHEWCQDVYDGTNYAKDTVNVIDYDLYFVFRGGSFYSDANHCRVKNRNYALFNARNFSLGFRIAHDI